MLLMSFESSAVAASVCVTEDGKLLAQSFQNCGLTHSRTLLPMAESLLKSINIPIDKIDAFAVSYGPGSFTGVRIGVSTVKGLALGTDKKCIGISSLEAMARGLGSQDKTICSVMDARAGQVYNALFENTDGSFKRICDDRAISIDDLSSHLISLNKSYILVGDGANLCYNSLKDKVSHLYLASPNLMYPTAYGVACAALEEKERFISADNLVPFYLRLPQAERERLKKV